MAPNKDILRLLRERCGNLEKALEASRAINGQMLEEKDALSHRLRERCGNLEKALEASRAINDQMLEEKDASSQENHNVKQELHASIAMNDQMLKVCRENGIYISGQMLEEIHKLIQEKALMHAEEKALMAEENKTLLAKIKLLERRVCDKDCVSCVIVSICEKMYSDVSKFCCRQLEKIITLSPGPEIEPEDLKCVHFMRILEGRDVVTEYAKYNYPPQLPPCIRHVEMVEAWKTLTTMDVSLRVVIIGRVNSEANGDGHVEVCYLDTRRPDGRVKIHDPQSEMSEQRLEWGRQDFIDHVQGDGGVIFYTVNLGKLENLITKHKDILHLEMSNRNLANVAL